MSIRFLSESDNSGNNPNYLTFRRPGVLTISDDRGNGKYVTLSARDRRELACALLKDGFDVSLGETSDGRPIIKAIEKRGPVPKVGEFYRVKGTSIMAHPWCNSPIVEVIETPVDLSEHAVRIRTKDGDTIVWYNRPRLEGPLNVSVVTEWVVEG